MYNTALKRKWDKQSILDYAVQTAREDERAKAEDRERKILADAEANERKILSDAEAEKRQIFSDVELKTRAIAAILKKQGVPTSDIATALGLTIAEVEDL